MSILTRWYYNIHITNIRAARRCIPNKVSVSDLFQNKGRKVLYCQNEYDCICATLSFTLKSDKTVNPAVLEYSIVMVVNAMFRLYKQVADKGAQGNKGATPPPPYYHHHHHQQRPNLVNKNVPLKLEKAWICIRFIVNTKIQQNDNLNDCICIMVLSV